MNSEDDELCLVKDEPMSQSDFPYDMDFPSVVEGEESLFNDSLSNIDSPISLPMLGDDEDDDRSSDTLTPDPSSVRIIRSDRTRKKKASMVELVDMFGKPVKDELQHGYRIVRELMSRQSSTGNGPFIHPPDRKEHTEFYKMVENPLFLINMKEKFEKLEYESVTDFVRDVRNMEEHVMTYYGPEHAKSRKAQKFDVMLEQKLALLPREIRDLTTLAMSHGKSSTSGNTRRSRQNNPSLYTSEVLARLRLEVKEKESKMRKQQIADRQKERKDYEEGLNTWESNIFTGNEYEQMRSIYELPQIGLFLYLCQVPLNIGEIPQFEVERFLLLPKQSQSLHIVMTSLLSTPYQRQYVDRVPPMPYEIWSVKLCRRLNAWYKLLSTVKDFGLAADRLGLDQKFWHVVGRLRNPLEAKSFHELSFYQRVWILKSLCDNCLNEQTSLRDAIDQQPSDDAREYVLGTDSMGNTFLHFPQFCGADLRVCRLAPKKRIKQTQVSAKKPVTSNVPLSSPIDVCAASPGDIPRVDSPSARELRMARRKASTMHYLETTSRKTQRALDRLRDTLHLPSDTEESDSGTPTHRKCKSQLDHQEQTHSGNTKTLLQYTDDSKTLISDICSTNKKMINDSITAQDDSLTSDPFPEKTLMSTNGEGIGSSPDRTIDTNAAEKESLTMEGIGETDPGNSSEHDITDISADTTPNHRSTAHTQVTQYTVTAGGSDSAISTNSKDAVSSKYATAGVDIMAAGDAISSSTCIPTKPDVGLTSGEDATSGVDAALGDISSGVVGALEEICEEEVDLITEPDDLDSFTIVCETVDELKELKDWYSPHSRKRSEVELHEKLSLLAQELQPWANKLILANQKAKSKLRHEQQSYVEPVDKRVDPEAEWYAEEEEEIQEDEEKTSSVSEAENEHEQQDTTTPTNTQIITRKSKRSKTIENQAEDPGDEDYGVSAFGRKRKRRVIPNNSEYQQVKKKKKEELVPKKTESVETCPKGETPVNNSTSTDQNPDGAFSLVKIHDQMYLIPTTQLPSLLNQPGARQVVQVVNKPVRLTNGKPLKEATTNVPQRVVVKSSEPSALPPSNLTTIAQPVIQTQTAISSSTSLTSLIMTQTVPTTATSGLRSVLEAPVASTGDKRILISSNQLAHRYVLGKNLVSQSQDTSYSIAKNNSPLIVRSVDNTGRSRVIPGIVQPKAQTKTVATNSSEPPHMLSSTTGIISPDGILRHKVNVSLSKDEMAEFVAKLSPKPPKYATNRTVKSLLAERGDAVETLPVMATVGKSVALASKSDPAANVLGTVVGTLQCLTPSVAQMIQTSALDEAVKAVVTEPIKTTLPTAAIKIPIPLTLPVAQPRRPSTQTTQAMKGPLSAVSTATESSILNQQKAVTISVPVSSSDSGVIGTCMTTIPPSSFVSTTTPTSIIIPATNSNSGNPGKVLLKVMPANVTVSPTIQTVRTTQASSGVENIIKLAPGEAAQHVTFNLNGQTMSVPIRLQHNQRPATVRLGGARVATPINIQTVVGGARVNTPIGVQTMGGARVNTPISVQTMGGAKVNTSISVQRVGGARVNVPLNIKTVGGLRVNAPINVQPGIGLRPRTPIIVRNKAQDNGNIILHASQSKPITLQLGPAGTPNVINQPIRLGGAQTFVPAGRQKQQLLLVNPQALNKPSTLGIASGKPQMLVCTVADNGGINPIQQSSQPITLMAPDTQSATAAPEPSAMLLLADAAADSTQRGEATIK